MAFEFKTTLLREKFVLRDPAGDLSDTPPVIALSNRMVLSLVSKYASENETFVIRTQNMHSCARFAAAIAKEFQERGNITQRVRPFNWKHLWSDVTKGYEKDWNRDIWATVYYKGRPIFSDGMHHPLLDIIEQCDAANREDYAQSVLFAEAAFQKAGKAMTITHDSNIALILSMKDDEAKCGVILRGANRKTTFNYTVRPLKEGDEGIRIPTILTVSAAFLEGVQLSFSVGVSNRKRMEDLFERYSDEDRKRKRGAERLSNLTNAIESMEKKFHVQYRPDRPDFTAMVSEAEAFAIKIIQPLLDARLEQPLETPPVA